MDQKEQSNQEEKKQLLPAINLPKGGGAIRGIDEKFSVNAVNGTAAFSIPIPLSPSRNGFGPSLTLNYNSGAGNSAFGLGWQLGIPSIARKTDKKLPEYQDALDSDIFLLSGTEDLIPFIDKESDGWVTDPTRYEDGIEYVVKRYIPRIEGLFAIIEKWTNTLNNEVHWRTISRDNVHSYYGLSDQSRLSDPQNKSRVFEWFLCKTHDDKGSIIIYNYKKEDHSGIGQHQHEKNRNRNCTQIYLKTVLYGNKTPYYLTDRDPDEDDFLFKVIFDYGEHNAALNTPVNVDQELNSWTTRNDPFSSYRPGFELRTYRQCKRVMLFHCFDTELPHSNYLVKSLELYYSEPKNLPNNYTGFSYLIKARQNGHKWNDETNSYSTKSLPEIELTYQEHVWNEEIQEVDRESIMHAPSGIQKNNSIWIDLFNEGISGILTEQNEQLFYKTNLGDGKFSPARVVSPKPNVPGLATGQSAVLDLEGNGAKYLVQSSEGINGFYKLNAEDSWEPFRPFENHPQLNNRVKKQFIDLNGDGIAEILIQEEDKLRWYTGKGEKGFEVSKLISKEIDDEKGPTMLFGDASQAIILADINGDGLSDIIKIRNGHICYWPNLGYGKFGAKVTMDNAPVFDHPDTFNPDYLRLADLDGSGIPDIIYLGKNDFRIWMNLNGNEWATEPVTMPAFPNIDRYSNISVLDFLGSGTACIVYSSPLPGKAGQPLQYIDLMGGKKPHVLTGYSNNCGKEVFVEYKSSTHYYLEDKKAGRDWITKLPFPVHCISRITTVDHIRETRYANTYTYSHGYFDFPEKEFRGFARVEQLDTEEYSLFKLNEARNVVSEEFHQAPVRSVSWFHTGAFLGKERILHQCKHEYFQNTAFSEYDLPEYVLADDLPTEEYAEALRALKGMPLRSEVYAEDNTALADKPYAVTQTHVEIKRIQARANNPYGSFMAIPSESISYNYDRNISDPRISHTFILETDELGNPLKTAAVIYARLNRPDSPAIPDKVWEEQQKSHIVYNEALYTNDIADPSNRIYRLRTAYESKSYELSGITPGPGSFLTKKELISRLHLLEANPEKEIAFEEEFDGTLQHRLSSHSRIYFLKPDLSGPLPAGQLSSHGMAHKSYQLAYTQNLVTKHFGNKVTPLMLAEANYVHLDNDDTRWWSQTGTALFPENARNHFYMPVGSRDVYGNESYVAFDRYDLLVESTTDAIGNTASTINDYRVLSPVLLTDINRNRSAVEMDELGLVTRSAVMGKEDFPEGDTLADPTVWMEYDLLNWKTNRKPNYIRAMSREQHGQPDTRWQERYIYSDGSGGVIMTKAQAEPGKALRWNDTTKQLEEIEAATRWVGNGRTVVNNKGNAIKQYEPYFSTTHDYEQEDALVEIGFSPLVYYDAMGRHIRTEFPDGTFTKAEFDPWYSRSYDVNDTVKDSRWYTALGSPDPDSEPEPSDPERRAAWLAAKHYNTVGTAYLDTLGRAFYTEENHGNGKITATFLESDLTRRYSRYYDQKKRLVAESYSNIMGTGIYSKTAEKGENWFFNDVSGRPVKIWDNDLKEYRSTYDKLNRPVSSFVRQNDTEYLFSHTVYADYIFDTATAQRMNMKGGAYRVYDQSGSTTIKKLDFKGNVLEEERKLIKDYKAKITDWNIPENYTSLAMLDQATGILLDEEVFSSGAELDALNRPTRVDMHGGTVYFPTYNTAGILETMEAKIQGEHQLTTFLASQDYNAKGQRQFAEYGNGTITRFFYDERTQRLNRLMTKRKNDSDTQALQDLKYTFDPSGNITHIRDDAQQTHFFRNSVVYPENKYEYDAAYRLIKACGREHGSTLSNLQSASKDLPFINQLPHQNDTKAIRNYTELYKYDDLGNIKSLQHLAQNSNWTRRYLYEYEGDTNNATNRLKATNADGDANDIFSNTYAHDRWGNMIRMPHLQNMVWNFLDQLKEVDLGGGGKVYYIYNSKGKRVKKVIERPGEKTEERIYLGSVEIYREKQLTQPEPDLERYTIHIADNTGRIAQIDLKTIDRNNRDTVNPLNQALIRYQYNNHLGSAILETDRSGNVISYEEYHPYGSSAYRISKPGTDLSLKRYRFGGKECDDETGLYYFNARYYCCWLGRWTSSDPAGFVDGMNLYRFCRNNPIRYTDPNGTEPPEPRADLPSAGITIDGDGVRWRPGQMPAKIDPLPNFNEMPQGDSRQPYTWLGVVSSTRTQKKDEQEKTPPKSDGVSIPTRTELQPGPASPTPGALNPIPKLDLPQAPPGTDFEAAERKARADYRAEHNIKGRDTAVQHPAKWRDGARTNLDPSITNDPDFLHPISNVRGTGGTVDGKEYATEHTYADRGLYPKAAQEKKEKYGWFADERVTHVWAGQEVREKIYGSPGPSLFTKYIWAPMARGTAGYFGLEYVRNAIPFIVEVELGLMGLGMWLSKTKFAGLGASVFSLAAYVPVAGGGFLAGSFVGHTVENMVLEAGGSEELAAVLGGGSALAAGAAAGAAIGSVIPGIGTAVGAVVGAVVGFFGWLFD